MATQHTEIDEAKVEAFVGTVLGDTTATVSTVLAGIGDRLGLFKELAANGPATSEELARRAGVNERYAREWLAAMAAHGYLEYDGDTRRFALPPEHAPVLAQEAGPVFFGGVHQEILAALQVIPEVIEAFQRGGGVPQSSYPDDFYEGLSRFTSGWFENLLIPVWIPASPALQAKLETGATVADIGTGQGRALIKLAEQYPGVSGVGYDIHAPSVQRASSNAEEAGVADRVRFEQLDVARGIPGTFDVITTFDVIHDSADPQGILRAIRQALAPDGLYVCVDINCADDVEGNLNPLGAFFYGVSLLYCMTTSLASGGEGLGTAGLPESKLRELALEVGFASVERLPLDNPFNNVYVLRAD